MGKILRKEGKGWNREMEENGGKGIDGKQKEKK